ncbi:MAG: hypothetical protein H3C62_08630 [Gemmatimonadaceae bacterium]|nr:hypothetical protein [Gemmatimonadaceae bacterium]
MTMVNREDIEKFLDRLSSEGSTYREIEPGLWSVNPGGEFDMSVIVHHSPPVAVLRVKVMDYPDDDAMAARLNRRLLEFNATDLLHGSYGIDNGAIVLTEALELEHLDYTEFLAAYESITLALPSHLRELATITEAK